MKGNSQVEGKRFTGKARSTKEMKSTRNGKEMGKSLIYFSYFKIALKDH